MNPITVFKRKALPNLLLLVVSIAFSLLLAEAGLRLFMPASAIDTVSRSRATRAINNPTNVIVDPEFGFRPVLGSRGYSQYGTLVNHYPLEKREGITRLLFIGDSVTRRGTIIDALKQLYGEEKFEYWNAGVESFNTKQEVEYYKKYNASIKPDHVILTFHLNDFKATPVAFYTDDDKLVIYTPNRPLTPINRWLFTNSHLYRFVLVAALNQRDTDAIEAEIHQSLQELRDLLSRDGIELTVLVFPWLDRYQEWPLFRKQARDTILRLLEDLQIQYIDLLDPLHAALEAGVEVKEKPRDRTHPSSEVAVYFARYFFEQDQRMRLLTK